MSPKQSYPNDQPIDPVSQALNVMSQAIADNVDPVSATLTAAEALSPAQKHALGVNIIGVLASLDDDSGPMDTPIRQALSQVVAGLK